MVDEFTARELLSDPSDNYFAATPHDSNDEAFVSKALYIGGAGDVVAVMVDGTAVTFTGALAGSVLPIRAKRVNSTSTTATGIVFLA